MKNKIKSILKQELSWAYVGLFVCAIFMACGIGLLFIGISGGAFGATSPSIFLCAISFALLSFATFLFIMCLKRLIPYFQSLKALKYGTDATATICGYTAHSIKHSGLSNLVAWNYNTFYSIHLRFHDENGNEIIFKTGLNYNQEQFKQLSAIPKIKIKRYKNTAVIVEEITDPLDYDFKELPKKLRINSILVVILAWISVLLMVAGITWLCILSFKVIKGLNKYGLGLLISGTILIIISGILKSFIIYSTEKFVKKELPYARKYAKKLQKKNRRKEKENQMINKIEE